MPALEPKRTFTNADANAAAPQPGLGARLWAWAVLLVIGVAWGYTVILAKVIAASGAHPIGVAMWTSLFATGILLAYCAARRRKVSLRRQFVGLYAACGFLGLVIPAVTLYAVAGHLTAGILSITAAVGPILTFLLAAFFGLERMISTRLLGVAFGALAVALLVLPETGLPDQAAAPWVLLACLPGLCYALENMVLAFRMPEGASPFMVTCGAYLVSACTLSLLATATGSFLPLSVPFGQREWAMVGMAAINAVAYGLFIYLITHAGPVFATQVAYIVTVSGVVWGIVIFDERHTHWVWLSLVSILAGLMLVRPRRHRRKAGRDV